MIQTIAGLSISFVGTVLVAFSMKRGKVTVKKDSDDPWEHTIDFKVTMFRVGVALLGLGFLVQVWGVALG